MPRTPYVCRRCTPLLCCGCSQVARTGEPATQGELGSHVPISRFPGKTQQQPGRGPEGPSAGPAPRPPRVRPQHRILGQARLTAKARGPEIRREGLCGWGMVSAGAWVRLPWRAGGPGGSGWLAAFPLSLPHFAEKESLLVGESHSLGSSSASPPSVAVSSQGGGAPPLGGSVPSAPEWESFLLCGLMKFSHKNKQN